DVPWLVGTARAGVAARQAENPVQLALGMMEPARACPAVGTAVNRLVTVLGAHPPQLRREKIRGFVPVKLDERVLAAPVAAARPVFEPAAPHCWPGHPGRVAQACDDIAQQRRGSWIGWMRHHFDAARGTCPDTECTPV